MILTLEDGHRKRSTPGLPDYINSSKSIFKKMEWGMTMFVSKEYCLLRSLVRLASYNE